ncbi:MAG: aspartate--tRNA(Asn) ligase [Spirochaetaceae bacterium]|nr:MAG: aspartate--tRNA(Asn) ligase [Spirochaetaceae bacterium]
MERTPAAEISAMAAGTDVRVAGWVHRVRELGQVSFVVLRDRSGFVQIVYEGSSPVTPETVVSIQGRTASNEKAPGGMEVQAIATEVLGPAAADAPISVAGDPDSIGIETLLDHRILSLRMPKVRGMFELQSEIVRLFADYLRGYDFTEVKTSKLIGSGTEGGTGLFEVDYFGERVFLAQSPQFYKQAMVASGLERVFEIGAAYRAEKHDTPRHLNEYVSLDVEMGFIDGIDDLMDLELGILSHIFDGIRDGSAAKVLTEYGASVPDRETLFKTPRIDYEEAKNIASERTGKKLFDLNPEAERALCDWALAEHGIEAVFVTGFPRKKRPFYTWPDGRQTASFDLLFRGLEITTGGKRIHDYDMLVAELPKFGMKPEDLGDYLTIFRYGCPPHGGFAIGLERLTQKILGLDNIKAASLFPRDRKRVRP